MGRASHFRKHREEAADSSQTPQLPIQLRCEWSRTTSAVCGGPVPIGEEKATSVNVQDGA